jgi:hypothetical protein
MNLDPGRPILLLADQAWDAAGGGAVILRSLLGDAVDGNGLIWVTPTRLDQDPERGHYGLRSGSAGRGRFSILSDTLWHASKLADEVKALANGVNAAAVWAVLHGSTVAIASKLARIIDLPMHASVHDDPVYATALRSRRLMLFAPIIARQFRSALRATRSVDVVCENMARRYERKYGVQSAVLHRATSDTVLPGATYDAAIDGLSIGILGNLYGYRQLLTLGWAVEMAARRLNLRPRIVICGQGDGERLKRDLAGRVEVEVTGHVPEANGIERLRRCGILYLNYPFGWLDKVLRETSFPTKLSTYVYAARPILVHAPMGSSVDCLAGFGNYAVPWQTMNPADGADILATLMTNVGVRESFHEQAEAVRMRYFDQNVQRATLDRLLRGLAPTTEPCLAKGS